MAKRAPTTPNADAWKLVDRLQLAALLGLHPDSVTDLTRMGMPVVTLGGHGKRSVYDAVECLAWVRKRDGTNSRGENAKEIAQTRAYDAQAALNELKLKVQRGELVEFNEVVRASEAFVKAWSAKIRALPHRLLQQGLISRDRKTEVSTVCLELLGEIAKFNTLADANTAAAELEQLSA